jgi:hypothetical protein
MYGSYRMSREPNRTLNRIFTRKANYGTASPAVPTEKNLNRVYGNAFNIKALNIRDDKFTLLGGNFEVKISEDAIGNLNTPLSKEQIMKSITGHPEKITPLGNHEYTIALDPPAGMSGIGRLVTGKLSPAASGRYIFEIGMMRAPNVKGGSRRVRKTKRRKTRSRR